MRSMNSTEQPPTAQQVDTTVGESRNFADAMTELEAALAAGVPIADLLAAQAVRHAR